MIYLPVRFDQDKKNCKFFNVFSILSRGVCQYVELKQMLVSSPKSSGLTIQILKSRFQSTVFKSQASSLNITWSSNY